MAVNLKDEKEGFALLQAAQNAPFTETTRIFYFDTILGPARLTFDHADFDLWSTISVNHRAKGMKIQMDI